MTDATLIHDDESTYDHEKAKRAVRMLLEAVGTDPDRDGLVETWERRVPDAFRTLTEGFRETEKPTMRTFPAEGSGLVIKTSIPVYSMCEHHLLPFYGIAHVAYRPGDEVVGLSKLTRYVRWQSRKLSMQERLTREIAEGLADELDAEAVMVEIAATHMCEAMRGVETETETRTTVTVGEPTAEERTQFRSATDRAEAER
ncbi:MULTISPECIES: GTP cyclohydrolase I [unclassified Haladaptatus]|uniref:GTP cyclohydrolase I n=1 Tax=unclassified Haladaptatus TaxID=2622732 RepID=UPI0023E76385|nr:MULTISPECIES: GTP cyclohydrolase I [unclassified Haladaptatus]